MNLSYHMLNLKNYIKQERIDVCNQLWKKFDKGNTGFINEKDLGTMLRLLEYNPTERELIEMKEMLKSVNPQEDPDKISKEGFFACVARKERDTDSKEELENCFKIWDPQNSGLIEEKLFRYMMCKMGDTFTNEEIDALFKEANNMQLIVVQNEINYLNYKNFIELLKGNYNPSPKDDGKGKKGKKK